MTGKAGGLGMLCVFLSTAISAGTLENIGAVTLPNGKVELKLSFDSAPPKIQGYVIDKPPRISLDLPGTKSSVNKYNAINTENIKSVTVIEGERRTRLIVNLDRPENYQTRQSKNNLFVTIGGSTLIAPRQPASLPAPSVEPPTPAKVASPTRVTNSEKVAPPFKGTVAGNSLFDIGFERGASGEGTVLIQLSSKDVQMNLEEQGSRIRLTFPGAGLPDSLRNRFDVIDFATPVQYISARVEDNNTVVVIEPQGGYDYLAWQSGDLLTVSVRPLTPEEAAKKGSSKVAYTGDKLSLNFQDIEVRAVLQILADFKGLNLVASDAVSGNVTLTLKSVPWDQALDIVLQSKGLGQRLDNNVLVVAPAEELAAQEREDLASQQKIVELSPIRSDLIQINYGDATDIANVLRSEEGNRILSERGSVQVLKRTNSLLLSETQEKLDEIRALIEKVDIPVRQVQIEARIVAADTNFRKELGVKWGGSLQLGNSNNLQIGGLNGRWSSGNGNAPGADLRSEGQFATTGLFTDLGTTEPATSALSIGLLTDNTLLNLEISALENDGGGEIISQPKIITSDKHTALIESGEEVPYQESAANGNATVSFKKALLSLEVTPQITPDGRIIMTIKLTNNEVDRSTDESVPSIDTTELSTKVLIEDGQTIVLGGIFKNTTNQSVSKVPLLGDLPGIGRLFRKNVDIDEKAETLVFITPKILSGEIALR